MKHADDQAARRRKTNMTLFELRSTVNTLQAEAEAHEGQMKELEEQLAKQQEEHEFMGGMLQSRDRDMHAVLFQLECHQGDVEEMMLRLTERQQKVRSPAEVSLLFSPLQHRFHTSMACAPDPRAGTRVATTAGRTALRQRTAAGRCR